MKSQLNEVQQLQKIAGLISENEINIGDDGYGGTSITVSQTNNGIEIIRRDANDMNRVSQKIYLPTDPESIDKLIDFLEQVKSNPREKKPTKTYSDDELKNLAKQRLKADFGRDF